jgi:two-component system sensor histidine kinase KdpD
MSRLQTGSLEVDTVPVGLEEVVPLALGSLGSVADDVVVDVPDGLPRVQADPGLLERAVANVVANAIRHGAGSPVRIVAGRAGDTIDLRVADRGPGVPPAARESVFRPFQRLGDAPAGEGVGLGLAVARGFVGAMGGEIELEDTPGGGLTVVIRLALGEEP